MKSNLNSASVDFGVPLHSVEWLVAIMRTLLNPEGGCPWDQEQTLQTLKQYLVEECYEVVDAIDSGDREHHREELGDLLFQIVFQAELAKLSFAEIIQSIGEKLIRRHPHVFGDIKVSGTDEILSNWEKIKAEEKKAKLSTGQGAKAEQGPFAGIPRAMPSLLRTMALCQRAEKHGFRWNTTDDAWNKIDEEKGELQAAIHADAPEEIQHGVQHDQIQHELGDLLFSIVSWANRKGLNAEDALRQANTRFETRLGNVFRTLNERGQTATEVSTEELITLWNTQR